MTGLDGAWVALAVALAAAAGWLLPRPAPGRHPRLGVALVLLAAGPVAVLARRRHRAARAVVAAQVLEACDVVSGELAAGSPTGHALARAAEVCPLLGTARDAGRLGSDVPSALRRAAETPGAEDLRLLAAAWQVAHHSGRGLATVTARVARRLRAQRRTARLVEAELSSARATARLVAVLPVAAWVMGAGTGGRPVEFLLGGPVGLACLALGLGLTAAGLWWIEALADRAAR